MRAAELTRQLQVLHEMMEVGFPNKNWVTIGSIVTIDKGGKLNRYFLLPAGAGTELNSAEDPIKVISPSSPFGTRLMGAQVNDEIVDGSIVLAIH